MNLSEGGVFVPEDAIDQKQASFAAETSGKISEEKVMSSSERITNNPKFTVVTDAVPIYSELGMQGLIPTEKLTREAIIQRTVQLHTPFFDVRSTSERPLEETPLEELPTGYEDKVLDRIWTKAEAIEVFGDNEVAEQKTGKRWTAEDTVKYFAFEGKKIRAVMNRKFPKYEGLLDSLAKSGKIYNTGGEVGDIQISMLLELDGELGKMVAKLNGNPSREPGNISYDFRDRVYKRINQTGVPAGKLIDYSGGERKLALPNLFSGQLIKRGDLETHADHDTGFYRIEPEQTLQGALSTLSQKELKDWKLVRNAGFLLNDPLLRLVIDSYKELSMKDSKGEVLDPYMQEAKSAWRSKFGKLN